MKEYSEGSIIKELRRHFQNGYTYRVDNAFIFAPDWESDFFCMNRTGWSFEFEVKISRSDFKADFKKKKHYFFVNPEERKLIPNRFYYVVPEGLISQDEIPQYAGLITISERSITIVKRAPFIHRRKIDFRRFLCDKFYNRWLDEKRRNSLLEYDHKNLLQKMEDVSQTKAA